MLIDDTVAGAAEVDERVDWIVDACSAEGVDVDYLVMETSCSESIEQLFRIFFPVPDPGARALGSSTDVPVVDPVLADDRWLSNGEPGRGSPPSRPLRLPGARRRAAAEQEAHEPRRTGSRGTREHAIHLDVELWSRESGGLGRRSPVWSCPLLAAWWQLLRLGVPVENGGERPFRPIPRVANAAPFTARANLTVLPLDFVGVEHAVTAILRRVVLPAHWRAHWEPDASDAALVHGGPLERLSYVFAGALPGPVGR